MRALPFLIQFIIYCSNDNRNRHSATISTVYLNCNTVLENRRTDGQRGFSHRVQFILKIKSNQLSKNKINFHRYNNSNNNQIVYIVLNRHKLFTISFTSAHCIHNSKQHSFTENFKYRQQICKQGENIPTSTKTQQSRASWLKRIEATRTKFVKNTLMKILKPHKMYTISYHMKEMMLKKNYQKVVICFTFAITALVIMVLPHVLISSRIHHPRHVRYTTDLKYILFWRKTKSQRSRLAHHKPAEFLTGQQMFINQKCPYINCYITYDKTTLANDEDFDAVVFDIDNVLKMDVNFLNLTRTPEQLYIFRSSETPEKHSLCDHDLDYFFNMTWTYRLDSDIPQPFLEIYSSNKTLVGPKTNMNWIQKMGKTKKFSNKIKQKKKAVAWILTKCKLKSKHGDYIKELRDELKGYNYTLDIYGPCSQNKCPGGSAIKCYKMVEKEYFFQIVVEEYLSKDFVTEVMVTAMSHIAIPIVLGPADYSK